MTEIGHSGCKLMLGRRMFVAIASSILAQFVFMSVIVLITNLSVRHPLSWLNETWSIITCFRMWCYFTVLATVIVLQAVICSKDYLNAPPHLKSRFDALCGMFTPHNFLVGSLHASIGAILVWLHLSLKGGEYGSLTVYCASGRGYCLVEEHCFLLLGGLWTGLYHFVKTNFRVMRCLEFLPIPVSKFAQIKRGVGSLVPSAMIGAVWPTLYYISLYYFLGAYTRDIIVSALFLSVESRPLDGLSGLLDPSLVFHAWLYSALFVLTTNTMHLLFQACLTEWTPFEISRRSVYEEETTGMSLPEALAMEKVPIMQHLGYLDLVTLAQKDKRRRAQLFALSQPGGHPYNWNCIVEKCNALLVKFTADAENVSAVKRDEASRPLETSVDRVDKEYAYRMRNLVENRAATTKTEEEVAKQPGVSLVAEFLRNKRESFVSYLLSKPLIFYFFGKQSDSDVRHVLANGQTIVWAADAVSSLAVVSLEEDPYGIVQKDLPSVVENLLAVKQAVDKLQKINILMRKPQNDDKTIRTILTSMRMAIKRSIYRIVANFGDYIDDIALEKNARNQLESFLAYRE